MRLVDGQMQRTERYKRIEWLIEESSPSSKIISYKASEASATQVDVLIWDRSITDTPANRARVINVALQISSPNPRT